MSFSLALLSVYEEHFISLISPVTSGTGIPGLCGTGFMVERTFGYFKWILFFRFIPKMKIHTNTQAKNTQLRCRRVLTDHPLQ